MIRTTLIALSAILLLSACNTIQGIGQDMSSAGRGIADTAVSAKDKLSGKEEGQH